MHCKNLLNANNNIINTKPNNYGYRYLCHNKVSAIIAKHGYIIDSDYCYMIAVIEKICKVPATKTYYYEHIIAT